MMIFQTGSLLGFLKAEDLELSHIKPHGALYGMASKDEGIAKAAVGVAKTFGVPFMGASEQRLRVNVVVDPSVRRFAWNAARVDCEGARGAFHCGVVCRCVTMQRLTVVCLNHVHHQTSTTHPKAN